MDSNNLAQLRERILRDFTRHDLVKFGKFMLKSGEESSYYVDLRESTMYAELFQDLVELIKNVIQHNTSYSNGNSNGDSSTNGARAPVAIVGVPYGVVPLAGAVAHACKAVYYPLRKEVKGYGRQIDSVAFNNFQYIVVEDVISSGASIVESIRKLEGKKVTDIVILVNREQGGDELLASEFPHIKVHSIFRVSEIIKRANEIKNGSS